MTPQQPFDLPQIGSPSFTPLLLRYVLAHPSLGGWPINPSLFSVLLLAMIVRKGGAVIDTGKRDVDNLVRVIQHMIKLIFDLRVYHLSLDEHSGLEHLENNLSHQVSKPNSPLLDRKYEDDERSHKQAQRHKETEDEIEVLVITGLENASSPVRVKLAEIMTKKRIRVSHGQKNEGDVTGDGSERKFNPLIIWVRVEGKEVPSWMIDHFMLGLNIDSEEIEPPPSDLNYPPSGEGILPKTYINQLASLLPFVHTHAPLKIHMSNLLSAVSSHPGLRTAMTGRSTRRFGEYIQAHRLLSGSFTVPYTFLENSSTQHRDGEDSMKGKGLGGGIGGVDTWAEMAGEEPSLTKFASETEGDVEDVYCTPANVEGVWKVFVGHRCRRREEREEVMWLIKGSAVDGDETSMRKSGNRRGSDKILDEILRTV
ncbi:hypothetical protein L486_00734 [Kwoniella mangroviensis CBS 10435]|uniref:Uncharacterized protein n=1 Tax=Kwoniella mangroviensis CBS 10435 TaxID=1331196 RepID=A0A1B9IZX6_9TREE|nr:uncharacterized protein I203_04266 [Kwoniella mangroviensis CBS 8507]OCF61090.1 hypothetical protein L486_00734 [Kwoniella mangroviensis CBS 10435]OCF66690.1 hypothetical protein I203_04266 [Kwoniella mangroviensis CBS 8507]